jgi:hypothetical protein
MQLPSRQVPRVSAETESTFYLMLAGLRHNYPFTSPTFERPRVLDFVYGLRQPNRQDRLTLANKIKA